MAFIDATVVNVALPNIQTGLHASASEAQWVMESYALLLAAMLLVGGSLGDRFGRRRIFATGIAVFALAWRSRISRPFGCQPTGCVGPLFATVALGGIVYAFIEAPTRDWSSVAVRSAL